MSVLLDHAGYLIQRFKITTISRSGSYTTIETGTGRAPMMSRDWRDALTNATYNAVYKHVNKARGKSNPKVTLYSEPKIVYRTPTRTGVRVSSDKRGRLIYRNDRGQFAKKPDGAINLDMKEYREAF